jgi:hypothetical protein
MNDDSMNKLGPNGQKDGVWTWVPKTNAIEPATSRRRRR